ncbi:MAG: DNA-3-methyladenine glycosylase [Thaumarchaeota archaeon]|nr:DNA-3-methyladenine glycosylase [Nitrososphaerota archaeon]
MNPISRPFYLRNTVEVAMDLLGKKLVRKVDGLVLSGIICETEAYCHREDPASHAYAGQTERNRAMFGQVGMAYVYFTYGMHYCVNAVARDRNSEAGAVLIRAIIPTEGITFMKDQRGTEILENLANGPAKLTQAMKITKKQYEEDLTLKSDLYITEGVPVNREMVESKPRIGIRKAAENRWNFSMTPSGGSRMLSKALRQG